jgi:ketosteroid isomerase-like protein
MTLGPPPTPGCDERIQRNLAAHAAAIAAVRAGEVPLHILAPAFRIENRASAITDYVYRGAAGWRELMTDLFEEFRGRPRYELEEIIEATGEYVVAAYCICGKGAASGGRLEFHWYGVTWFRDGKAVRSVGFATRDLALSAAYAPQQLAA